MSNFYFFARSRLTRTLGALALAFSLSSCASKILTVENSEEILATREYEKVINVEALPEDHARSGNVPGEYVRIDMPPYTPPPSQQSELPGGALATGNGKKGAKGKGKGKQAKDGALLVGGESSAAGKSGPTISAKSGKKSKNGAADAKAGGLAKAPAPVSDRRQPELEDATGFSGRRPIVDPFRVGEAVTLELSYFGVAAGDMTLEVRPFKQVNGRKAYHFTGLTKSTPVFSVFYSVDDRVETFVDYQDLIPFSYSLHVKESKQLREVRSYFDWKALRGYVWDKKVTKEKGAEEKKYEWDIPPFSQNVFSAPFYLRMFKLEPGKKVQFRVGHEGKNIVVTGDVLRREKLVTAIGEFNTVVVKPTIEIDGVFKPMGDILFWMTDDDRKFLVRIESKIKIGKVVGALKKIVPGE